MRASGGTKMATNRLDNALKNTIKHWKYISHDIRQPSNHDDYIRLSDFLDRLLDIVGEDENHKLIGLVDVISHMISMYDERHNDQIKDISGIKALKFLIEQHDLTQSDFPEIGSQGVISEILNGKRNLNLKQIKKLAKRFHVSVETFID